jgi:hypothetical protein
LPRIAQDLKAALDHFTLIAASGHWFLLETLVELREHRLVGRGF